MEQLTLWSEGAPANPFRSPENERGSKANRDSCSSISAQFVSLVLITLSGRTSQERSRARKGRLSDSSYPRWMTSGMVWRGEYWTRNSSEYHKDADVSFLSDVLVTRWVPLKYFLSPKACAGIIRRAVTRGRPLPPMLAEALFEVILRWCVADKHSGKAGSMGWMLEASPTVRSAYPPAVCFQQNQRDEVRLMGGDGLIAGALSANAGMKNTNYICMADDNAKAAIDFNLCGSLKVGGVTFGCLRARSLGRSAHATTKASHRDQSRRAKW